MKRKRKSTKYDDKYPSWIVVTRQSDGSYIPQLFKGDNALVIYDCEEEAWSEIEHKNQEVVKVTFSCSMDSIAQFIPKHLRNNMS